MILKEVEKVEVTCLVDNNVDLLLPNTEVARRPVLASNWYEQPLIAEHGFCAALTLHIDHAGGLLSLRNKMNMIQRIPLVLHEDAFRNRLVKFQDGRTVNLPAPNRSLLTNAGYDIIEKHSSSLWIDDRVLVTGEIPRTNSFEKGFPNH